MTAALIIAAGQTASQSRFEPLKPVGTISAVQRLIHIFAQAGLERVVVVGGNNYEELEKHVARMGVVCLHNPHHARSEMLDSVKLGLEYLKGKCRRVLVTPVDVPLFSVETVELLQKSGEKLAAPSHNGKLGHPLLVSAKLFPTVLAYSGEGGLAAAVKSSKQAMHYIEVPDEGVLLDIDKQPDFEHVLQAHSLNKTHPDIKVYLAREQTFFGPGPYQLLNLIDETDSLRTACQQMGISYSKGWHMVEKMEQQTGLELVQRKRGGAARGSSSLTAAGRQLTERYRNFVKDCRKQCQKLFEKHFGDSL